MTENGYVGNSACANCHADIYESYSRTAMARTSGLADTNLVPGLFKHDPSSILYRIYEEGGKAYLSYERLGDASTRGRQELEYYVGSGTLGLTYLYTIDGFLFQSPVNYYAQMSLWNMAPGYASVREMPLNHPVDPTCLYCHASQVQQPILGTQNRFAGPPFRQNGVGCERCHGPGSEHIQGNGTMVNPLKLPPESRDSVCAQCHMEGEASIERPGKKLSSFRPGDRLSDYVSIFIYEDKPKRGLRAVSHVEALSQSICKQRSGDRMSCLRCHDPHFVPAAQERASYYRKKCLACHGGQRYEQQHYATNPDCASCHMRKSISRDIGHTTVTDHRIPSEPVGPTVEAVPGQKLIPFGTKKTDVRDLGLAYGELAERGDPFYRSEAFRLLQEALPLYPKDPELLTRLAYLYQERGDVEHAAELYKRALRQDPGRAVAASDLGVIYAAQGRLDRALSLWRSTFETHPHLSEAGVNAGLMILCGQGRPDQTRELLLRVLKFNPDMRKAKEMLHRLDNGQLRCNAR